MTDPAPFLRYVRRNLEDFAANIQNAIEPENLRNPKKKLDPEMVKRAAMAFLLGLEEVEVPSPSEIEQIRVDARVLDLMTKGTEPAEAARRLGCAPSTVYRRLKRARNIKRAA